MQGYSNVGENESDYGLTAPLLAYVETHRKPLIPKQHREDVLLDGEPRV